MDSLDHYVQVAAASLTLLQVSPTTLRSLCRMNQRQAVFEFPPEGHWSQCFSRQRQLRAQLQWISRVSLLQSARQRNSRL